MIEPMLLTMADELPTGEKWRYEIKYDGFRVILTWTENGITLTSRNGKDLTERFPEIISLSEQLTPPSLPITLDGELVILNTPFQANFSLLQQRGRLRSSDKINYYATRRPATFMAFDFINKPNETYKKRKQQLKEIIHHLDSPRIQYVQEYKEINDIKSIVFTHLGEGIIAKTTNSKYTPGKRVRSWIKYKNWRSVSGFLTSFNPQNSYYQIEGVDGEEHFPIGTFKHGFDKEEEQTLRTFFKQKGIKKGKSWILEPSVCVDVHCLHADQGEMREPMFSRFRFDLSPEECTKDKLKWDLSLFPTEVDFTHTDKELWPGKTKEDYLIYLRNIAPYLLPFIKEKKITLIRYPDGIYKESFFQKHLPDYAPDFVGEWVEAGEAFITCSNLPAFLWLGNQGALEFHIPFQKAGGKDPDEIVFDLDPPGREQFPLAILAAQLLKHLLDELEVESFVKTSGNKGMQIHIPIEEGSMSYEETRRFTHSLVKLLIKEKPDVFTIERLKKNRGNRLYLDYVQHAEGKTIVAPYSARATEKGTVAAPLFWSEVKKGLTPEQFTIDTTIKRVQDLGCPFQDYAHARTRQPIEQMKTMFHKA
ncbi:DNA ligase D [Halobacillus mangrovi]|uniref:DNA ligase D n=1 Tax=Halobacillus mangrovi TaxID=402384 RepID=A0A1W5ZR97_9BACI|nr:DNA ligase D [Halobacillus mangrovi]ARI75814.1 DNA ligase D [Halobacillus mangrovi]